jgi:hypothetical protein
VQKLEIGFQIGKDRRIDQSLRVAFFSTSCTF